MAILPILFNGDMVRAILDGKKTQTRRPVKPQPEECKSPPLAQVLGVFDYCTDFPEHGKSYYWKNDGYGTWNSTEAFFPKYNEGDILYVRETFKVHGMYTDCVRLVYKATENRAWSETIESFPVELAEKQGYSTSTTAPIKYIPSIHMPRWCARIFLKVTSVRCKKLSSITLLEAQGEGFETTTEFLETWEKMYPKFGKDPFVWIYEFEHCERPEEFVQPMWGN